MPSRTPPKHLELDPRHIVAHPERCKDPVGRAPAEQDHQKRTPNLQPSHPYNLADLAVEEPGELSPSRARTEQDQRVLLVYFLPAANVLLVCILQAADARSGTPHPPGWTGLGRAAELDEVLLHDLEGASTTFFGGGSCRIAESIEIAAEASLVNFATKAHEVGNQVARGVPKLPTIEDVLQRAAARGGLFGPLGELDGCPVRDPPTNDAKHDLIICILIMLHNIVVYVIEICLEEEQVRVHRAGPAVGAGVRGRAEREETAEKLAVLASPF